MDLVKITVPLPEDNLLQADTESVWAEHQQGGGYRIDSIPFLAKGISYSDIVETEMQNDMLVYKRVLRPGGHSTYRIYAKDGWNKPNVLTLIEALKKLGCAVENATEKLIAVDVPPESDVYKVYGTLQDAEHSGEIDFEEGHCGHPVGG